jgi:hypothetical protein
MLHGDYMDDIIRQNLPGSSFSQQYFLAGDNNFASANKLPIMEIRGNFAVRLGVLNEA